MSARRPRPREIAVSDELMAPVSNQVELCYQTFGEPDHPPLLLVMGLGGPMLWWDADLCATLAERGFYVVRYDNRDTGRSTRIRQPVSRAAIAQAALGRPVRPPYAISDLAGDAVGLLDHLGIDRAHIAGVSMGGMIGQTLAVEHAGRVASLTSIMSSTGRRTVGWQHPRLLPALITRRGGDREAYIRSSVDYWKTIGSPAYPIPEEKRRARATDTWDRGFSNDGVMRHVLAVLTQPDRTRALQSLRIPVTVVHGTADPLVHVSGGRATARAVPGAELLLLDGVGHDLPEQIFDTVADAIQRTSERA